jgi:DNA-binding response OmpR family regulator
LSKPRILLAEDDPDSREITSLILTIDGFEVTPAVEAESIIALVENEHFDAVLLDNRMPGMSDTELCREIRKFNSGLPIVFYSAAASEADKRGASECGAQAYLTKPEGIINLTQTLRGVISAPPVSDQVSWSEMTTSPGLSQPCLKQNSCIRGERPGECFKVYASSAHRHRPRIPFYFET